MLIAVVHASTGKRLQPKNVKREGSFTGGRRLLLCSWVEEPASGRTELLRADRMLKSPPTLSH
jgi:hypothetical protein